MSKFLTASIGRKFVMSLSGLFLVVFIAVHLGLNLLLIFDNSGDLFNQGAHFMATNPLIKIMEPILGLGFIIHIVWSFFLEYQNWKARPVKYAKKNMSGASSWASRNMLVLGGLVLVFLIIHIINFFVKMKFTGDPLLAEVTINGEHMHNAYALVSSAFINSAALGIFYILGGILLGIHLSHGFWSAFQTLGLNNKHWLNRWKVIGTIYAILIAVGYAVIPLYFMLGLYK
ncbi:MULTISPECIES: succinate dehydrogenase cytochrome b subunit [Draconibacterium]|uniref:Succinate dehydrogenase n=1 Tax=Draconibacterium sediminis TaxID=1544798 RepID=A0A0D8JCD0_9BACT|nr:succinate dehydrogenase cytochrome b subunit [Draconibacterium sediminis]KJF44369.1 succinate dehydrogenase [Draconibacterium sediminis]